MAASIADHGWFPQAPQRPAVGDGRRRELQFVVGGPAGASSGRKGLDHTCACPDLARYHSRQRSAVVSHNTNTSTRARRPPWGPATASRSLLSAVSCLLSAVCCRRACIRVLFSTPRHARNGPLLTCPGVRGVRLQPPAGPGEAQPYTSIADFSLPKHTACSRRVSRRGLTTLACHAQVFIWAPPLAYQRQISRPWLPTLWSDSVFLDTAAQEALSARSNRRFCYRHAPLFWGDDRLLLQPRPFTGPLLA